MHRGILEVYLIELSTLMAAVGSRNAGLSPRDQVAAKVPSDEFETGCIEDATIEAVVDEAFTNLIDSPLRLTPSPAVGFAVRRLCRRIGELLETSFFYDVRFDFLEEVQIVLPLIERGPPGTLPSWTGNPLCGYLTSAECVACLSQEEPSHPEQVVRAGINEVWEWMEAASMEGKDLIGFWC